MTVLNRYRSFVIKKRSNVIYGCNRTGNDFAVYGK